MANGDQRKRLEELLFGKKPTDQQFPTLPPPNLPPPNFPRDAPFQPPVFQPPTPPPRQEFPQEATGRPRLPGQLLPGSPFGEEDLERLRRLNEQIFNLPDLNNALLNNLGNFLESPTDLFLNETLMNFLFNPQAFQNQRLPFTPEVQQLLDFSILNLLNPGGPPGGQQTFEELIQRLSGGPLESMTPGFNQELMERFLAPGLPFEDTQQNLAEFLTQRTQFGEGLTPEEVEAQTELLLTPLKRARELASQDLKAQAAARGLTSGDAPIQERFARLDEELARQAGALAQQQLLEDFGLRRAAAELDLQRSQALTNLIQGRQQLDTSTQLAIINELGRSLRGEEERDLQRENLLINALLPERARRDAQSLEAYRLVADFVLGERRLSAGQQNELLQLAIQLSLGNTSAGIELGRLLNSRDLAEIALNREDARALGGFIANLIAGGLTLAGGIFGGGGGGRFPLPDLTDIFGPSGQGTPPFNPNPFGGGPLGFDPFGQTGPGFFNPLIQNVFDAGLGDRDLTRLLFR